MPNVGSLERPLSPVLRQYPFSLCGSLVMLARRESKTDGEETRNHSSPRPWDAWERRSLRKQIKEGVCQRSSRSNGYSQGPEILKALESLKSRS